jgi:hypothetical protein
MPNLSVVVLVLFCTILPAQAQNSVDDLNPVLKVLYEAHLSGSIELAGRCDPLRLPVFSQPERTASVDSSPLAVLREITASDRGMKVRQDPDGTIRMSEKAVPHDILNVRIKHIVFENFAHHEIHSASFAVRVILSAPEVQSFMAAHAIAGPQSNEIGVSVPYGAVEVWPPESPHISGSLNDVTFSEALDRALRAFPGEVLVYWNCPATHGKAESNRTKVPHNQSEQSSASMNCPTSSVFPKDLPSPFCLPSSVLSKLPQFFTVSWNEPPDQRRVFFLFMAMKWVGGRMFVVAG